MPSADEVRFVMPYYLKMMGLNAIWDERKPPIRRVRRAARSASTDTVVNFLRAEWRPRVMGAWFSARQSPEVIGSALSLNLATSGGTLTAPPLAAVATFLLGTDALPALHAYADAAASDSYLGADGFVSAAIEHLGGTGLVTPTPEDRQYLERMLKVATVIRGSSLRDR